MEMNVRSKIVSDLMLSHDMETEEDMKEDVVRDVVEDTVESYFEFIDSIRFIELITSIESQFGIELSTKDLMRSDTRKFEAFVTMIEKYVNS